MIQGPVSDWFVQALEENWCLETSVNFEFDEDNPSSGQCVPTALIVQDVYGGNLVRGMCGDASHYWNELPDGTEVDLTRQQFGGKELVRDEYRTREYVLQDPLTRSRYILLKQKMILSFKEMMLSDA